MLVTIVVLILFKYSVVNTMVSSGLEKHVDQVGDYEKNRDDSRNLKSPVVEVLVEALVVECLAVSYTILENSRKS